MAIDYGALLKGLGAGYLEGVKLKQSQDELNLKKKKQALETQLLTEQLNIVEKGTPAAGATPSSDIFKQPAEIKTPKIFDPFKPMSSFSSLSDFSISSAPSAPSAPQTGRVGEGLVALPRMEAPTAPPRRQPIIPAVPATAATPDITREPTPEEKTELYNRMLKEGTGAVPPGYEFKPTATGTGADVKYGQVTVTPTAETLPKFQEFFTGISFSENVPTTVPKTSYDKFLGASANKSLIELKKLYWSAKSKAGEVTEKDKASIYQTVLKLQGSGDYFYYTNEQKAELEIFKDEFTPTSVKSKIQAKKETGKQVEKPPFAGSTIGQTATKGTTTFTWDGKEWK